MATSKQAERQDKADQKRVDRLRYYPKDIVRKLERSKSSPLYKGRKKSARKSTR